MNSLEKIHSEDNLPPGWANESMHQLATSRSGNGKLIKGKLYDQQSSDAPYPGFSASGQDVWLNSYDHEGRAIIISAVGARCGKAFEADGKWSAIANTHIVRPNEDILNVKFFWYLLNDEKFWIRGGSAQPFVKVHKTFERSLALPPLAEQKRIADKLEAVLGRVDACRARLDRIPDLLKRFRQSVLAAATSGQLTAEWRMTNGENEEWREVTLGEIAEVQGGVTKDSKKQSSEDEEVPYLRVANVQRGYIDLSEVKMIRIPSNRLPSLLLKKGDVLFNEGGDLDKLGRGWIWDGQISRCSYQNHVFRARLHNPDDQPKYISWWGNYRGLDYFIRSGKQTTNLASINKSMLCSLPVSLPTPPEQQEIVRRVEALFAFADRIEASLTTAQAQVERLTPATLAKAFRGELVPQDPNDEPASHLLERLRNQPVVSKQRQRAPVSSVPISPPEPVATSPKETHLSTAKSDTSAPPAKRAKSTKKPTEPPTPIHDLDRNELIALLRDVIATHGPCDRTTAIQQVAYALNYQRAGSAVSAEVDHAIRAAVRRCVLLNEAGQLSVNRISIADMEAEDRDFMKDQFLAAISQGGRVWIEREDAARLYTQWFGLRRTGSQIQDRVKSLINGLLRTQRLEASGTLIRRL